MKSDRGSSTTVADRTTEPLIGFDIGEAEQLAEREEKGIDVEWEDVLGRIRYQPDGVTPMTVNVCGSLSKRFRKVQELQRGRMVREANAGLRAEEESDEVVGARSLQEQTEAVAACINSWSAGFTTPDGRAYECTLKNAVRLLALNPHMQTKLEKKMRDHAGFFAQSSNGSKPS